MMFADGFWLGSLQPFDSIFDVDISFADFSNAAAMWMCLVALLSFHEFGHAPGPQTETQETQTKFPAELRPNLNLHEESSCALASEGPS